MTRRIVHAIKVELDAWLGGQRAAAAALQCQLQRRLAARGRGLARPAMVNELSSNFVPGFVILSTAGRSLYI